MWPWQLNQVFLCWCSRFEGKNIKYLSKNGHSTILNSVFTTRRDVLTLDSWILSLTVWLFLNKLKMSTDNLAVSRFSAFFFKYNFSTCTAYLRHVYQVFFYKIVLPYLESRNLTNCLTKKNYENIFNVKIFFAFLINIYVFVVVIAVSCDVVVTVG